MSMVWLACARPSRSLWAIWLTSEHGLFDKLDERSNICALLAK
jgi:hypothetical protein